MTVAEAISVAREPDDARRPGPATTEDFARYRPTCCRCAAPVALGDVGSCREVGPQLLCVACAEGRAHMPAEPAKEIVMGDSSAYWPTGRCGHKVRPPRTEANDCAKCRKAAAHKSQRGPLSPEHREAISRGMMAARARKATTEPGAAALSTGTPVPALPAISTLPADYLAACVREAKRRAADALLLREALAA